MPIPRRTRPQTPGELAYCAASQLELEMRAAYPAMVYPVESIESIAYRENTDRAYRASFAKAEAKP